MGTCLISLCLQNPSKARRGGGSICRLKSQRAYIEGNPKQMEMEQTGLTLDWEVLSGTFGCPPEFPEDNGSYRRSGELTPS